MCIYSMLMNDDSINDLVLHVPMYDSSVPSHMKIILFSFTTVDKYKVLSFGCKINMVS